MKSFEKRRERSDNMSHWFSVKTRFQSVSAIEKAAHEFGCMLRHRQNCRGYADQKKECDLVMALPGEYDLGFEKQTDGSYTVSADFWSDHISEYLADPDVLAKAEETARQLQSENKYSEADSLMAEAKMSRFTQAYNKHAVMELAQAQGLQYMEMVQSDGTIVLELVGNPY
jgi:hypothetical protein